MPNFRHLFDFIPELLYIFEDSSQRIPTIITLKFVTVVIIVQFYAYKPYIIMITEQTALIDLYLGASEFYYIGTRSGYAQV